MALLADFAARLRDVEKEARTPPPRVAALNPPVHHYCPNDDSPMIDLSSGRCVGIFFSGRLFFPAGPGGDAPLGAQVLRRRADCPAECGPLILYAHAHARTHTNTHTSYRGEYC